MREHAYGCFYPLLCNGSFRELRIFPEDDTYDKSKHVGDILASDVYILVYVIFFYHGATALVGQGLLIIEDS
jgi:hypothetical protein